MVMAYRFTLPSGFENDYFNYFGYASTQYGIQYGLIGVWVNNSNLLGVMTFNYIPSTFTYNGTTYYTYVVEKNTYTSVIVPGKKPIFVRGNILYTYGSYTNGYYMYGYDVRSGKIIGSILLSQSSNIIASNPCWYIDEASRTMFAANQVGSSFYLYWSSFKTPFIDTFYSFSSVMLVSSGYCEPAEFLRINNASMLVSVGGSNIAVVDINNPTSFSIKTLPTIPAVLGIHNGSIYLANGNTIYFLDYNLDVTGSYIITGWYVAPCCIGYISSYLVVMGAMSPAYNPIKLYAIYNLENGSMISFTYYGIHAYDFKHGVYYDFISGKYITAIVPENPLNIDIYTSQMTKDNLYIMASISIAGLAPASNYLVRFYYSIIPYEIGVTSTGLPYMIEPLYNYIGSSYTNSSGIASILFAISNIKGIQEYNYFVEVAPEVLYNG